MLSDALLLVDLPELGDRDAAGELLIEGVFSSLERETHLFPQPLMIGQPARLLCTELKWCRLAARAPLQALQTQRRRLGNREYPPDATDSGAKDRSCLG